MDQHDEGEEADDIDKAATQPGDVGLIKEGADQEADCKDAEAVVTKVEEEHKAIAARKDAASFQNDGEDDDGHNQEHSTLYEPGKEVADGIDPHHFHVLWDKRK